jgi:hypothetical protein
MIRAFTILCVSLTLALSAFGAEKKEIPLPQLHGLYSTAGITERISEFQLDTIPSTVYNVWLKLSGIQYAGSWCLDGWCGPWPFAFATSIPDSNSGGSWLASAKVSTNCVCQDYSEPFSVEIPFVASDGATWQLLLSGRGTIDLNGKPGPWNHCFDCWAWFEPSADVQYAALVIEGDFIVATRGLTWGSIKALFQK